MFEKSRNDSTYYIKDNISFIHFYMCKMNGVINGNNCDKVVITDDIDSKDMLTINANSSAFIISDVNMFMFKVSTDASRLVLFKDKYYVDNASNTEILGNITSLDGYIDSNNLVIRDSTINMDKLYFKGDNILLNNTEGKINKVYLDNVSSIEIIDSAFESFYGNFNNCSIPNIVNSIWLFDTPLKFNGSIIGSKTKGIILDDTFDEGILLTRSLVTTILRSIKDDKVKSLKHRS